MKEKKVTHIADVVYELEKIKSSIKNDNIDLYFMDKSKLDILINKITETEEYKESIKEAQKIPCLNEDDNEKSIFNEMCEKSSDGWIGIEDYIDEIVKRKVKKYLYDHPDWYYDRYEKIPYWLRPDYNKPEPTYWKEDTGMFKVDLENQREMFKVHRESEPIYTTYNTYTAQPNPNRITILS